MEKIELNVSGMKCGGCESTVRERLGACEGVRSVQADHKAGKVIVEYDPGLGDVSVFRKVLDEAGFPVQ